ncbi:MAG TPA: 16S rRNA (adenine(1518)-N(6)/adenine(1519)-N(6))-dimethyltransferase RsmA [Gemmatimonadaceae bacterium]|nr:16S rRNA (adenine(1518)-N(6)/adenine(1519)-N(6))-dimethyltransferase RsmA [Gemmatimonadaceae bacterium]
MPPRRPRRTDFPPTLKRLGQHFLADRRVLVAIADALELTGQETVVEIGPGRGALTDVLAERAARVVAIEIDHALAELLRARYADRPHVEIVERDVLAVDLAAAAGGPFVLAGNVPYYITTPILFHALEPVPPRRAVFLVQREVAERIVAAPNTAEYGALSVNVQAVAEARIAFGVPPGAFRPPPKVDSAVIVVTPAARPIVGPDEATAYRKLVQACFGLRRKQMRRVLRSVRGMSAEDAEWVLARVGVVPEARPETLAPEDFARLLRAL